MRNTNLAEVEKTLNQILLINDRKPLTEEHIYGAPFMDYVSAEDETLVKLYLASEDEWAFNEIVNRYSTKIYGLAMKFTKNERDADDVLQEVFLAIFEKLGTFRNESKFSTWLYSLASNTALLYLRKQRKYRSEIPVGDAASDGDAKENMVPDEDWRFIPDRILMQTRKREKIEEVMSGIPDTYSTVLRLKDMEGRTNKEVGELLGLSLPAVKSRVHRARLQMKDILSAQNAIEHY